MTPEELHRAVIRAVAFGDTEDEHRLRRRFRRLDRDTAADYLRATAFVCLAYRFGEAATPDRVGRGHAVSDHTDPGHASSDHTGSEHAASLEADSGHAVFDRVGLDRAVLDHAELGRFMAELRAAGPALRPPSNLLEVEAVVRGVYGEPHMLEEIGPKQHREALAFVLRYLTDSIPEIREDFDSVIDRSQALQRRWLVGTPDGSSSAPERA